MLRRLIKLTSRIFIYSDVGMDAQSPHCAKGVSVGLGHGEERGLLFPILWFESSRKCPYLPASPVRLWRSLAWVSLVARKAGRQLCHRMRLAGGDSEGATGPAGAGGAGSPRHIQVLTPQAFAFAVKLQGSAFSQETSDLAGLPLASQ